MFGISVNLSFKAIRPLQWYKNIIIFIPLFFIENIYLNILPDFLLTFISFSLIASAGYLINGIVDKEDDALDPEKKMRPIASNKLSIKIATFISIGCVFLSALVAYMVNMNMVLLLLTYFGSSVLYSLFIKKIKFLDILFLAILHMFRFFAGIMLIEDYVISLTLLLALLMFFVYLASLKRLISTLPYDL